MRERHMDPRMMSFANSVRKHQEKPANKRCAREDMFLTDFQMVLNEKGEKTDVVRVMAEYMSFQGTPKPSEVVSFIRASTDGRLIPLCETIKDFSPKRSCIVLACKIKPIVASSKTKKVRFLTRVSAVDTDNKVWDVEQTSKGDGIKILKRVDADEMEGILKKKISLQRTGSFGTLREAEGHLTVEKGDRVVVFMKDGTRERAVVTSMDGSFVSVKIEKTNTSKKVPAASILSIIEKSPEHSRKTAEEMKNYYNELLPGYGDLFTNPK